MQQVMDSLKDDPELRERLRIEAEADAVEQDKYDRAKQSAAKVLKQAIRVAIRTPNPRKRKWRWNMKAKDKRKVAIWSAVIIVGLLLLPWAAQLTHASERTKQYQDQDQDQAQGQDQSQIQGQDQTASAFVTDSSEVTTEMNTENSSSNVVLVPNNNTEPCLRIFGISFSSNGSAGGIGIPWRSKKCDYEQAADDAFAGGERELGWFWKCQNPNLYKSFKDKGEEADVAQGKCWNKMVGSVTDLNTIDGLRGRIEFLLSERTIDRTKCEEAKDRIVEGCYK